MSQLTDAALKVAISQIGQKEVPLGSNWGHPVQDYLASVGINFPASWCMAFVYWCFEHVAVMQEGIANPLVKTGGVLHAWETADPKEKISATEAPQPGDIFIMNFGHGLGHTGIVEAINGHTINTIEGNTNDTGSREGIEVCRRQRIISPLIIGYLRY